MSLEVDLKPSVYWNGYDLPAGTPCTILLSEVSRVLKPSTELERFLLDLVEAVAATPPKSADEEELEDLEDSLSEAKRKVAFLTGQSRAMVDAIKAADLASKSTGSLLERFMNIQAALAQVTAEIRLNRHQWS